MADPLAHLIARRRRPRVQITYDLYADGALEKVELPFVVGVLADLSADGAADLPPLRDRRFVNIDRDNLDAVLEKAAPRLALRVPNALTADGGELNVDLRFRTMDDFTPDRVAEQVPPLKELLEVRRNLARLLDKTGVNEQLARRLDDVLGDPRRARALAAELGIAPADDGEADPASVRALVDRVAAGPADSADAESAMRYWLSEIDRRLSAQVDAVMHHPAFQKLEGTWRGLHYLAHQTNTGPLLEIKVLNATKTEVSNDLQNCAEYDEIRLFREVYEEGFGVFGGHPFGLLVGDFEFGRSNEDLGLLERMAGLAAAVQAPFVADASPHMFGFDRFTELPNPRDLGRIFAAVDYAGWHAFRESSDSRYVGLTLPRVLARLPYGQDFIPVDAFAYEELVDGRDHDKYLWMGSAWAYAARVTDAFDKDGWFVRTRGVEGGGRVDGLPVHTFPTDEGDVAMKCPTEVAISDRREVELAKLGFLPLVHAKHRDFAVFMGTQSVHKPKQYDTPAATIHAEFSAKLNLRLCAARFAHVLMVMVRDKFGSFMELRDCENWLNEWLREYTVDPNGVSEDIRAQRPLADARVTLEPDPGRPRRYRMNLFLRPHYQLGDLDAMDTSMRLVFDVPKR